MTSYRYKLTTVSPVHIGTGGAMTPLEFHLGDELIVPDLDRIFVRHPAAAEQFTRRLAALAARDLAKTPLGDLIGESMLEDPEVIRYSMPGIRDREKRFDTLDKLESEARRGQGEVRVATKTPDDRVYIPGSSLKGTLKTAWAYQRLLDSPTDLDIIARVATEHGYDQSKRAEQELKRRVFQSPREGQDAAFDLFRVLQLGDTEPRPASDTLILAGERVLSASVRGGGETDVAASFKDYWVFCEAIDEGMEFEGRLGFDEQLLNNRRAVDRMGWSEAQRKLTIESLRAAVNRFAADLCEWEIEYFRCIRQTAGKCETDLASTFYEEMLGRIKDAPADTLYFSVGHGSGWHKLTIGLLLEKRLSKAQFNELRRKLRLDERHAEFEYPKSRKLVMRGETCADTPFGWVEMVLSQ